MPEPIRLAEDDFFHYFSDMTLVWGLVGGLINWRIQSFDQRIYPPLWTETERKVVNILGLVWAWNTLRMGYLQFFREKDMARWINSHDIYCLFMIMYTFYHGKIYQTSMKKLWQSVQQVLGGPFFNPVDVSKDKERECMICLGEFDSDSIRACMEGMEEFINDEGETKLIIKDMGKTHLFHQSCLQDWFYRDKKTCPACRGDLDMMFASKPFLENVRSYSSEFINQLRKDESHVLLRLASFIALAANAGYSFALNIEYNDIVANQVPEPAISLPGIISVYFSNAQSQQS